MYQLSNKQDNTGLIISNQKSFDFLSKKAQRGENIIVGGHPLLGLDGGKIQIYPQLEALENAFLLQQAHGGVMTLWISNPQHRHEHFLLPGIKNNRQSFCLKDLKPEIGDIYKDLLNKYDYKADQINIIFQDIANGYIKTQIIRSNTAQLIKMLLVVDNSNDAKVSYHNTCKSTATGFIKLTQKLRVSADNIIICFGSNSWCSYLDITGGIISAQYMHGVKTNIHFGYFDQGKKVPTIKCS